MEFFLAPLSRAVSDGVAETCERQLGERGWGVWAIERRDSGEFIGMAGLNMPSASLPFSPCVEVLWRLALDHWGQGFATEAARAVIECGFSVAKLDEIVAFTTVANVRSRNVMRKLGMRESLQFDHPGVPVEHPLRPHVLYRLASVERRT